MPSSNLPRVAGAIPFAALLLCVAEAGFSADTDWPAWRGPQGNGISLQQGLPLTWAEGVGVAWKVPLLGEGASTPVIAGGGIFLTTQQDDRLLLVALDAQTGREVWSRQTGTAPTPRTSDGRSTQKFHELHNNASPSPVTDGKRIVAHFGNGDLVAYDMAGAELWRHNLQQEFGGYSIWWGHANSPVLHGNLVISVCMQDSLAGVAEKLAPSYLVAHDLETGQQKWKSARMTGAEAEEGDAYTTPIFRQAGSRLELVLMGGNQLDAYDPQTGEQIWFLRGLKGGRTITGPVAGPGPGDQQMIYATQGMKGRLLAVLPEPESAGELPSGSIRWHESDATPDSCCPVVWDRLIFAVSDIGVAKCYDASTGRERWKKRLPGDYKASPLAAEGRVYFLNATGLCTVVAADDRYGVLSANQLDDDTIASPAVADGKLYIRGKKHLYCLDN